MSLQRKWWSSMGNLQDKETDREVITLRINVALDFLGFEEKAKVVANPGLSQHFHKMSC